MAHLPPSPGCSFLPFQTKIFLPFFLSTSHIVGKDGNAAWASRSPLSPVPVPRSVVGSLQGTRAAPGLPLGATAVLCPMPVLPKPPHSLQPLACPPATQHAAPWGCPPPEEAIPTVNLSNPPHGTTLTERSCFLHRAQPRNS